MGITQGERSLEIIEEHHLGGHLNTGTVVHAVRFSGIPGREARSKQRALDPGRITGQRAKVVETDGAEVEFCRGLGIRVRLDGVNPRTRHGQGGSVLERTAVVHAIVAETAQIGIAKDGGRISEVMAGSRAQPERVVAVYGKKETEVSCRFHRRIEPSSGQIAIALGTQAEPFLGGHSSQGSLQFGKTAVKGNRLHGADVLHLNLLIQRQGVHVSVGPHREAPRLGIGSRNAAVEVVGKGYHVALAAGAERARQVIETGRVPGGLERPEEILPLQVCVELVLERIAAPGRNAHTQLEGAEPHRVAKEDAVSQNRSHTVPGQRILKTGEGGIGSGKTHFLQGAVGRDGMVHIPKLHLGKRLFQKAHLLQGLRVILIRLLAIELHGIRILHHLAGKRHGLQAIPFELEGQDFPGSNLEGSEQADVRVGHHLCLAGFQVDLPEVGNAGIVGTANKVLIVQRETELSQVGILEGEEFHGIENGLREFFQVEKDERMLAVVSLAGERKVLSVMAHIQVKDAHAKGEGIDYLRVLQVPVHADDGLGAAVGKEAVEPVGGIVIHDIVYALELFLDYHLLPVKVVHFQPPHARVVHSIDQAPRIAVQRHESRIIQLDTIQIRELALLTGTKVQLQKVRETPGGVHGGIGLSRLRIVDKRRDGAKGLGGEGMRLCERERPDDGQILFLVLSFVLLPVIPHLAERLSVHLPELVAKEDAAVGRAVIEPDEVVVSVLLGEVVHEAGAVEVGVGAHLEVHGRAFRLQTHHGEELFSSVNDAAEVHFVVTAQGASYAAAQPGFHEARNTLVVPAGRIPARNAHVTPQGRYGMGTVHAHLGPEETPPAQVFPVILVRHHDMRILVAEKLPVTFAGWIDVVGHIERGHAHLDERARKRRGAAVTVVFPVGQEDKGRLRHIDGIGGPDLPVERRPVLIHAYHMGNVTREVFVKKNQTDIIRLVLIIRLSPRYQGKEKQSNG